MLDWIIGDPHSLPHPVRLIGSFISYLTRQLLRRETADQPDVKRELRHGIILVVTVLVATLTISASVMLAAYMLHPLLGMAVEAILTCYVLAARSLERESTKVQRAIDKGDTEAARQAVSMIVGRDTSVLDQDGIIRAAVETVAENTSDGVIAPLLYTVLGGPVLGLVYKAVNTMDSMVGYRNDRYLYYGRAAARTDDLVNYIPARISALLMILAAAICGYDFKGAKRIFLRDRYNHKSPNSAQTESVCAGALDLRLAGNAVYFGQLVEKPYIGDDVRPIESGDISRSNRLMLVTEILALLLCLIPLICMAIL